MMFELGKDEQIETNFLGKLEDPWLRFCFLLFSQQIRKGTAAVT